MVAPGQSSGRRRKALGVPVDDGHRVTLAYEFHTEAGADPAAADDDDVHRHHATRIDTPAQLMKA